MTNFQEMWIPCTADEYPEVKQLLEEMGCKVYGGDKWTFSNKGVITYHNGRFQSSLLPCKERPTVTLPELRAMAKPEATLYQPTSPSFGDFVGKQLNGTYWPELVGEKAINPNDELRLLKERVGIMERSIMGMETKINEIHKLLFEE